MKYVTKSAFIQFWPDSYAVTMTADVFQDNDRIPVKTGLLNADGEPLYRVQDSVQFGFVALGTKA